MRIVYVNVRLCCKLGLQLELLKQHLNLQQLEFRLERMWVLRNHVRVYRKLCLHVEYLWKLLYVYEL